MNHAAKELVKWDWQHCVHHNLSNNQMLSDYWHLVLYKSEILSETEKKFNGKVSTFEVSLQRWYFRNVLVSELKMTLDEEVPRPQLTHLQKIKCLVRTNHHLQCSQLHVSKKLRCRVFKMFSYLLNKHCNTCKSLTTNNQCPFFFHLNIKKFSMKDEREAALLISVNI